MLSWPASETKRARTPTIRPATKQILSRNQSQFDKKIIMSFGPSMHRNTMQSTSKLTVATVGIALTIAFLRGSFLLDFACGVGYCLITIGLFLLFVRSLTFEKKRSPMRALAVVILSVPIVYIMAFPGWINPEVQIFIDDQLTDRNARAELNSVFTTDPAFDELSFSIKHFKVVHVTISGSLPIDAITYDWALVGMRKV